MSHSRATGAPTPRHPGIPAWVRCLPGKLAWGLLVASTMRHDDRAPETRRFPRTAWSGLVELFDRDRSRRQVTAGEIGGGGVSLSTDAPLATGRFVTLRLGPGSGRPFTVVGKVVWSRPGPKPAMGVRFVDIAPGDRARIQAFVATRH